MARKALYKHATQVNTGTYPDDGSSPVGSDEWNEDPDQQGMLGFTPATATITIATGVATPTDSVCVAAAETGTADTLDKIAITNTNQYDLVYLFADTGDTITLTHTASPSADGHVFTVSEANETLSTTKPTILIRKGNFWYGYGGGTVSDGSITTAKLAADAVTAAKIADDVIDSEHLAAGGIDTEHLGALQVTTAKIAADAIDGTKIADDAINSEHYAAGSIDLEHMSSESVDEDNLHISNAGTNGEFLSKQSGNAGGLTWAAAGGFGAQQFYVDSGALIPTPSSTSGTATSFTQTRVLANGVAVTAVVFPEDSASDSRAVFNWIPPKNWDNGTIKVKPYWTAQDGTSTFTGNAVFGIDAVAVSDNDALNATFGTAITSTDAFILTDDLHVAPQTAAITVGGTPADADFVQIRIFRDASADTLSAGSNVELIGFVLEYTQDASTSSG